MKTKKLLSILLALMMMLSVVPMYASAATETLTTSNIQTLPTITVKDPNATTFYFGVEYRDIFSVADDEVVVDASGNQVAGHFEIRETSTIDIGSLEIKRLNLTFKPDDTEAYTTFNKNRVSIDTLTIEVLKTELALVDAENDSPKTTEAVASGTAISDIAISGGKVYNKNYPDREISVTDWTWQDTSLTITESGYYNAVIIFNYANDFIVPVYIEVESSVVVPEITEAPTATITYGQAWSDVTLTGGKVMAGDTEVAGKFTIDNVGTSVPNAGTYTPAVIFTPDDLEKYTTCEGTATVTVNPAPIKFVDENGADIVPEITVPYGTKLGDRGDGAGFLLKSYINLSGVLYIINFVDSEGNAIDSSTLIPVGTNEYKVKISTDNKNYENAELTCKFIVEPIVIEINDAGYRSSTNELYAYLGKTNIPGTFDIFVDGELVGDDLALTYKTVTCPWTPTETGEHTIKVVYNAVNENYVIADYEKAFTAKVQRTLTYDGYIMLSVGFRENATTAVMGDLVTIKPVLEDFGVWVITDANGNEVTLEGVDLTAREITFTMPDHDVKISFKTNTQLEQEEAAANCDHICHSDNPLFQILWKVLTFIFRLFDVQQYCDCGNLHYDAPLFG